jgi:Fe-Mn family superoxide dismutase
MPWDELKARRWPAFDTELEGISSDTMEDHFKLYEGYAKKANECRRILNEFDYSEIEGNQVYSPLRAVSIDYTFALLGFKNHAVRKAASAARGWVMVGYDLNDGSLFNYIMDTQNLWAVYNMCPVLALDVYEHAYARDFGATPDGRKQYVEAFFANLDWDHVNRQLAQAEAARAGAQQVGAEERVPTA